MKKAAPKKSPAKPAAKKAPNPAKPKNVVAPSSKKGKTSYTKQNVSDGTENKQKVAQPAHFYKPGQSGNPAGRPKGSKNKLGEQFLAALCDDFEKNGIEAIEAVRAERPDVYLQVISRVIPKDLNLNVGGTAFEKMWALVSSGELAKTVPTIIDHALSVEDDDDNQSRH